MEIFISLAITACFLAFILFILFLMLFTPSGKSAQIKKRTELKKIKEEIEKDIL